MGLISLVRKAAPWVLTALIVFWTVGPRHDRPHTGHAEIERFGAFFCLAFLFTLAYPRQKRWIALAMVVGAALLELGQLLVPHRDARLSDAVVKITGGLVGVALASLAARMAKPEGRASA